MTKVFSAKLLHSAWNLIKRTSLELYMKLIKTPEISYCTGGFVKFSTSRKDKELYYEIGKWDKALSNQIIIESGLVRDEEHLQELQSHRNVKVVI